MNRLKLLITSFLTLGIAVSTIQVNSAQVDATTLLAYLNNPDLPAVDTGLVLVTTPLTATDASRVVTIFHRAMKLSAVSFVDTTGSTSGTLTVEKLTGTTAAGSGTALLTGTIDISSGTGPAANTVVNGTLIATAASLTFAAGDRLGIVIGGTMTSLAGAIVTIALTPA